MTVKAQIEQSPKPHQEVGKGKEVSLAVKAIGTDISYQWLKDNEPLEDDSYIKGVTEKKLVIHRAGTDTAGNYYCTVRSASNKTTDQSETAHIDVGKFCHCIYIIVCTLNSHELTMPLLQ